MTVKTPTKFSVPKKIHTPPTLDHDGASKRKLSLPKFLDSPVSSKKSNVPKPLKLASPPPTLRRKKDNDMLRLQPPLYFAKRNVSGEIDMGTELVIEEAVDRKKSSWHSEALLSPTPIGANHGFRSSKSHAGPKRYNDEFCSMCEEPIEYTFVGEKIIELSCSHASHSECYLMLSKTIFMKGKYPRCKICCQAAKPEDEEVAHLLTSRILSDNPSKSHIEEQYVDYVTKLSCSNNGSSLFTPQDQVIHTADISCNGFGARLLETKKGCARFESPVTPMKTTVLNDQLKPEVQIVVKDDSKDEVKVAVSVYIPDRNEDLETTDDSDNMYRAQVLQDIRKTLRLDNDEDLGTILLYDKVYYSTDGSMQEATTANTVLYFFEKALIFHNVVTYKIEGKIPIEQVYRVNKLSPSLLLVDTKSTTFPELYISVDSSKNSKVADKWKYYLDNVGTAGLPHVKYMTESMSGERKDKWPTNGITKPWEQEQQSGLDLVVCFNTSFNMAPSKSRAEISKFLQCLHDELGDKDRIGLVIVGQDGYGRVGETGKYVGMVTKAWDGWQEIIDDLQFIDHEVFPDRNAEVGKMMEISHRLVSTTMADGNNHKKILVLQLAEGEEETTGDALEFAHHPRGKKYCTVLRDEYQCQIQLQPVFFRADHHTTCKAAIRDLRKPRLHSFSVVLEGGRTAVRFGDVMAGRLYTREVHLPLGAARGSQPAAVAPAATACWTDPLTGRTVTTTTN